MSQLNKESLLSKVQTVLGKLPQNPLGLHVEDARMVDGRWWVFVDIDREPPSRMEVWEAIADFEQRLEDEKLKVRVAST